MLRQTSGWVTCAKPSRRNTDPSVSHTFSRRFLKQNYPKYITSMTANLHKIWLHLSCRSVDLRVS